MFALFSLHFGEEEKKININCTMHATVLEITNGWSVRSKSVHRCWSQIRMVILTAVIYLASTAEALVLFGDK
jgi:hypothetical protein